MRISTITKREQMPTDRSEAPVRNQLNASFKFMVRPFTTVGVESLDLATWFEDEILEMIYDTKFESKITGIIVFPKIFDADIAPPPSDHLTYKRGEKSVFVGLNIGFRNWHSASRQEKLNILASNIRDSIQKIPDAYLTDIDRDKLIFALDHAHKRLIQRLTH
jgi:hypothetical protein